MKLLCGQVTPPLPLEVRDWMARSPSLPLIHFHYQATKNEKVISRYGFLGSIPIYIVGMSYFQVAADLMSIFYCTTFLATLQLYLCTHPSCFTHLYCVGSMNRPRHPMSHCTKLRFLVHILPHLMRYVWQADACFQLNLKVWQSLAMGVWVGMKLLL